jgi:hypothetical protein
MQIEHVAYQGALELCRPALENREARACQFCAPLEIEDVELLAEVPVGLGLEVEFPRLAPFSYFPICLLVGTVRNRFVRRVGNLEEQFEETEASNLEVESEIFFTSAMVFAASLPSFFSLAVSSEAAFLFERKSSNSFFSFLHFSSSESSSSTGYSPPLLSSVFLNCEKFSRISRMSSMKPLNQ